MVMDFTRYPSYRTPPTQEEGTMGIEVGKIVIQDGIASGRYTSQREEQAVRVFITTDGVALYTTGGAETARAALYANGNQLVLNPEQTIELAQLLLKAAEVQPEYATEENRIAEERTQLEAKYTSLLDGSRIDESVVVDVTDTRSGFIVTGKALG